jgi:predicted phage terminase large subunit-like protein
MIVSVLWPAWVWARQPEWSAIFGSYELGLVMRDAVKTRALVESPWFVQSFRTDRTGKLAWGFFKDQNLKKFFKNTRGGMRQATSVGSGTGYRADALIVDDPLSVDQAYSAVERESANRWFFETMSSRFNDQNNRTRVVIMQRVHEEDLAGEIIRRGGFQHLRLPSEFDPAKRAVVKALDGSLIFVDPRTQAGQLLFPEKFDLQAISAAKHDLGPYGYSAQHDQEPAPLSGGALKGEWFARRWLLPGETLRTGLDHACRAELVGKLIPTPFDRIVFVVDAAFKGSADSDRVAIGVFGQRGPDLFLIDLVWDQLTFSETLAALRTLVRRWPKTYEIVIEDKANGSALLDTLKGEIPGVVAINPDGGKESRILAMVPKLAAGNVWLPHSPNFTPSPRGNLAAIDGVITEAKAFPKGKNDDAIDMLAYAVNRYLTNSADAWLAAIANKGLDPLTFGR